MTDARYDPALTVPTEVVEAAMLILKWAQESGYDRGDEVWSVAGLGDVERVARAMVKAGWTPPHADKGSYRHQWEPIPASVAWSACTRCGVERNHHTINGVCPGDPA